VNTGLGLENPKATYATNLNADIKQTAHYVAMTKQSMKIDKKLIAGGNDQGPMLAPIQSKQIKMRDEFMQNL